MSVRIFQSNLSLSGDASVRSNCNKRTSKLFQMLLKNFTVFNVALMTINITAAKFVSIFLVKNPLGIKSGFWCLSLNLFSTLCPILTEVGFIALPGRNPIQFYVCLGSFPESMSSSPTKKNYPISTAIVLSLVWYVFVFVSAKFVKKPTEASCNILAVDSQAKPLLNLETIGQSVLTLVPVSVIYVTLNYVEPQKIPTFPYRHLLRFLQHGLSLAWNLVAIFIFMSKSKAMRATIWREAKDVCQMLREKLRMRSDVVEMIDLKL